jgi:hypothetical protein
VENVNTRQNCNTRALAQRQNLSDIPCERYIGRMVMHRSLVICAALLSGGGCRREASGPPPGTRVGYYVTPAGTSAGDGSDADPWSLSYALGGAGGQVNPGDTIWVRAGTYPGIFTSTLAGSPAAPIIVRGYPGERAVLNGNGSSNTLKIDGTYTWFWGLEVQVGTTGRTSLRQDAVYVRDASHVKLIHLLVHDGGSGIYTEPTSTDVEIYGCVIYNNGYQADATDRGHGHAIYIKNNSGTKLVRDNVMFNQFGFGLHQYSSLGSGSLVGITFKGNVAFNNGALAIAGTSEAANLLAGGEEVVSGAVVDSNLTYYSSSVTGMTANLKLGFFTTENAGVVARGNLAVGGDPVFDMRLWATATVSGNTWVGSAILVNLADTSDAGYTWTSNTNWRDPAANAWRFANGSASTFANFRTASGLAASDTAIAGTPAATQVFVRPSVYEPGLGFVVVYNWGGQGTAAANVAGILTNGNRYEVRSVQSLFGPALTSGTYRGGTIAIPLGAVTPPTPIGMGSSPAPATGPAFDVFVVTRVTP